jgi:CO/xanthine dehydrogenase Mo-binding subunit
VDGHVTTLSFADYKIPTMLDLPERTSVYMPEVPSGSAPHEGKSVGETHKPPTAGANAVSDAVGVRLTSLPITAEKLYTALRLWQFANEKSERASRTGRPFLLSGW